MMNKIKERMNSDRAAVGSIEIIVLIALAIFAALALFSFILKPSQESAQTVGTGIESAGQDAIDAMTGDYQ